MNNLRNIRKIAGLSIAELSKKTDIPIRTLEMWDSNKRIPQSYHRIKALAKVLDVSMDELMEYTLHVRAFVTALDADGSRVFVYGDSVADVSVAEIAHYIYVKSLSSNYRGHDYSFWWM